MKYLKIERGIAYYRRGKYRLRLDGERGSQDLLASWSKAHDNYERSPSNPIDSQILPDTFRAMAVAYLASSDFTNTKPETQRSYKRHTDLACRFFGEHIAEDIKMPHVLAVREKFSSTPAMANSLVRQIRIIYGWGKPRGMVTHNPADFSSTSVKDFELGTYLPWPEDLIGKFLDKAEPEVAWVTIFCLYTGQRIGDVLRMCWADISGGKIKVIQQKTGKELWIPLHPELKKLIKFIPRRALNILTTESGNAWTYDNWQEKSFNERKRLNASEFKTHGLRKNAVLRLSYAGCTTKQVGSITGQSDKMVDHYARHIEQQKLAKVGMEKYAVWTKSEQKVVKSGEKTNRERN